MLGSMSDVQAALCAAMCISSCPHYDTTYIKKILLQLSPLNMALSNAFSFLLFFPRRRYANMSCKCYCD